MKVRILGSGTLLPDPERGSPAHAVVFQDVLLLLDCGAGAARSLARLGLPWERISHLFVTHFHTDHLGGLAPLLFALKHGVPETRTLPLVFLGPIGLEGHLEALARAHGSFVVDPGFPVQVQELPPGGGWRDPLGRFHLVTRATPHTDRSLAVRVETENGVLGYTGDTGPDPGLGPFFRGVDALISECSHPPGKGMDTHLTPDDVASLGAAASPELLVTVHTYPPLLPRDVPDLVARAGYGGRVLPARDGLGLDLGSGRVDVLEPGQP